MTMTTAPDALTSGGAPEGATFAIRHRIGTPAPAASVFAALATVDGLARWWTTDTAGDGAAGGRLTFTFGAPDRSFTMAVLETVPDERVAWLVVEGPEEWIGTTVTFTLERDAASDETVIVFTHDGWREVVPFLHHCSTKWGIYLMSLRAVLDGRDGQPWPDDVKASAFD
jgi:uncharacterized protein YndB with AHSA1/START domain